MAKRGRPRKTGERYPSGDLKHRPEVKPISPALWQRIVQHGKMLGLDERLASELGRLNRFGELTAAQTVAGMRIGEIYGCYEGLKGLKRSVRSPSYNVGFGDASIAEELLTPEGLKNLEARIRSATEQFQRLVGFTGERGVFVPGEIPVRLLAPVEMLCVEDRAISPVLLPDIRTLFDRLASNWRIAGAKRVRTPQPRAAPAREPAAKPRVDLDRTVWESALRRLRPDLKPEQVRGAYGLVQALKQRAIFRRAKGEPEGNVHFPGGYDA